MKWKGLSLVCWGSGLHGCCVSCKKESFKFFYLLEICAWWFVYVLCSFGFWCVSILWLLPRVGSCVGDILEFWVSRQLLLGDWFRLECKVLSYFSLYFCIRVESLLKWSIFIYYFLLIKRNLNSYLSKHILWPLMHANMLWFSIFVWLN